MAEHAVGDPVLAETSGLVGDVSVVTADSATFTAETQVQTVTVPLVSGRTYKVCWMPHVVGPAAAAVMTLRIRENNVAGTGIQSMLVNSDADPGNHGFGGLMVGLYTAVATGNKTFSFTAALQSGTGNVRLDAASDRPALAWVEYWYG